MNLPVFCDAELNLPVLASLKSSVVANPLQIPSAF
jgi:hypothetical protein